MMHLYVVDTFRQGDNVTRKGRFAVCYPLAGGIFLRSLCFQRFYVHPQSPLMVFSKKATLNTENKALRVAKECFLKATSSMISLWAKRWWPFF